MTKMGTGSERAFFFPGSNYRKLFGLLFVPHRINAHQTGIVYCHPFSEENNMSHAIAVKACRAIQRLGYPVLRFDMSGCGDSAGDLDEITVQSWMEDICKAIEVVKRETGVKRAALFGLRLGGGLALLHAHKDTSTPFVILWEPVLDFAVYIRQFLRRAVASQIASNARNRVSVGMLEKKLIDEGKVSVIGYPISKALFDSFLAVGGQPMSTRPKGASLVVSVSQAEKPSMQLIRYNDFLRSVRASTTVKHVRAEPFWDRYWRWDCPEAIQSTTQWLSDMA